jgi:hypothetical protein
MSAATRVPAAKTGRLRVSVLCSHLVGLAKSCYDAAWIEQMGQGGKTRGRRSVLERRQIVGRNYEPGMSVARVTQSEKVKSH